MATPSNPGWVLGQVPTTSQWAAVWSGKVDYGPNGAPVNQGGTGALTAAGANYNLSQRALLGAGASSLVALTVYGVKTSAGAASLYLPALSGLVDGDWIRVSDVDFDANAHNVTLYGAGSDNIVLYSTSANSQVLSVAGFQAALTVNSGAWRLNV